MMKDKEFIETYTFISDVGKIYFTTGNIAQ